LVGVVGLLLLRCGAGWAGSDDDGLIKRVVVFGDSQAQGVAGGLQRVLIDDPR